MATMTEQIKIDGSGNAYVQTSDGVEFVGSWNPSLRQFTFENGDVWDVEPTTSIEAFLASFPTTEEAAERESLQERDELADLGLYDEPTICELCLTAVPSGPLCEACAGYDRWMQDNLGSRWS